MSLPTCFYSLAYPVYSYINPRIFSYTPFPIFPLTCPHFPLPVSSIMLLPSPFLCTLISIPVSLLTRLLHTILAYHTFPSPAFTCVVSNPHLPSHLSFRSPLILIPRIFPHKTTLFHIILASHLPLIHLHSCLVLRSHIIASFLTKNIFTHTFFLLSLFLLPTLTAAAASSSASTSYLCAY